MRIRFVFALVFALGSADCAIPTARAAEPPKVSVEFQPLASGVKRLMTALDALGAPLSEELAARIESGLDSGDSIELQRAIDSSVLAVVTISPEERVSARRGPVVADVQQAGYRPAILKILNHSTSTARLRISSPQAGPVYAGTAQLSMNRQQQLKLLENQNEEGSNERFLSVQIHDAPPMTPEMSGLEVEYALLLISSSQSGKREAVLHFDIGAGTADLEHRNELPVLMDVKPALPLRLRIRDHDGQPGIARLEFRDPSGRVFPAQAKREAPDFFFQSHVYRIDGESVLLPPGRFSVSSSRGPEYRVQETQIEMIPGQENQLSISLERWFNARDYGFFSGDHHIHAAGCAHYTRPTEGVSPGDMFRQVQGEGLNVGCVLTWGPCFDYQRQYFQADADMFGTRDTLLKYDLEISGFGSQALGHVCLLNLHDQTYPDSEGTKTKGWPTWTTPVMRWAKEQGGYAGYAHSASGLAIDPGPATQRMIRRFDTNDDGRLRASETVDALLPEPFRTIDADRDGGLSEQELVQSHQRAADRLPNLAIPEMNGVGAMEICVSTVAGVCDFISAMDTRRIQEWNTWYHLLNCGFPLKVSGETDFPCMSSRRVGKGRVYVHLGTDAELEFGAWCEALAKGSSYVSDGYAHLPKFSVNGVVPGDEEVRLDSPGEVTFTAQVAFAPQTPEAVAYGTQKNVVERAVVGDTVVLHGDRSDRWTQGGKRLVELIVNGESVYSSLIPADGKTHTIKANIPIAESSWVAVRQFPQLHSNPIPIIVSEKPIRASEDSARWCIEMTQLLWKNRERNIADHEREAAKEAFDHAIKVLSEIGDEAGGS
ncbi:MAG: CehA/McbA family metallohydrolase [Rubripirellula sp.]